MSVCPNCHTESPDFARFCTVCGSVLPSAQPSPVILPPKIPSFPMRWHKVYSGFLLPVFSFFSLLTAFLSYIGVTRLFEDPPEEALSLMENADLGMFLFFLSLSILLLVLRMKLRKLRYGALRFHNALCVLLCAASLICMDLQCRYFSFGTAVFFPLLMILLSLFSVLLQNLYYGRKRKILFTS